MRLKYARWQHLIIIICDITDRISMTQSKHFHHHWFQSDQPTQMTYNLLNCFLSDDDRGRCCLHQSLRERMRECFWRLPVTVTVTPLYLLHKHTLLFILLLSSVSALPLLLRTWKRQTAVQSMLEQLSLTCSIHTVWQTNSVYKTIKSFSKVPTKRKIPLKKFNKHWDKS